MEENRYYVYLHIKEDTGEPFYVGKGTKNRCSSVSKRSKFWNNIVTKHGFDIIFLESNLTESESYDREIYWINRIGRRDLGLGPLVNHRDGGEGGLNRVFTQEHKDKLSAKAKERGMSKEAIEKAKLLNFGNTYNLGKKRSEESKKKMSDSHKGKIPWNKGLPMSEEQKQKIRDFNLGKKRGKYKKRINKNDIIHTTFGEDREFL